MLNLFQHLKLGDPETILKRVQHKVQGDMYFVIINFSEVINIIRTI